MKIALLGYGRMGKAIEQIALSRQHEIVLKINEANSTGLIPTNLKKADVAIDFSLPLTAFDNISMCLENGVPVVSGTTGWLDQYDTIVKLCEAKKGAFFYASNFSVGVNVFMEINRQLARLMNGQTDYEVQVEEIHHIHKLDAPSGTALTLTNDIIKNIDRKESFKLVEDSSTTIEDNEIAIQSYRKGEVPGTHIINYISTVDTLKIEHEAKGRTGFATGAVLAAEWISGKVGVFGMRDMLQI